MFFLLTSPGFSETTYISPGIIISEKINELPLEELSKKCKALREKQKQSKKNWDKEFNDWGSQLHLVLTELGLRLGNPSYSTSDIKRLLGDPDLIKTNKDKRFILSISRSTDPNIIKDKDVEYLVYYWRGSHDYLYFICKDGTVQKSKWYFAYD